MSLDSGHQECKFASPPNFLNIMDARSSWTGSLYFPRMLAQLIRQGSAKKAQPNLFLQERVVSRSNRCGCRYSLYTHKDVKFDDQEISELLRNVEHEIVHDCPNHRDELWPS